MSSGCPASASAPPPHRTFRRRSGYSPDFMPVEALWRWLREDVTYNRCHNTREELIANVRRFEATINGDPIALADRLWVKDALDPDEEKLRIPR